MSLLLESERHADRTSRHSYCLMVLLAEARSRGPRMGALVLTACGTAQIALQVAHLGARGFLRKPICDLSTLSRIVNRALFEAHMPAEDCAS